MWSWILEKWGGLGPKGAVDPLEKKKGKHLCYTFPIYNGLKEGNALLPVRFNFALRYAITNVQVNNEELKLNATR